MFLKEVSDGFLLALLREGNQDAIDLLYERYHTFIYGIINDTFKNNLAYLDYEELYQEAMVVFISCIDKYDPDNGCFYFFVRKSIERRLRYFVRREQSKFSVLSLDEYMYDDCKERKIDCIKEEDEYNLLDYELRSRLCDFEHDILDLKTKGYTYEEMSSILGVGTQTIYRRINKIKNILKDITKN